MSAKSKQFTFVIFQLTYIPFYLKWHTLTNTHVITWFQIQCTNSIELLNNRWNAQPWNQQLIVSCLLFICSFSYYEIEILTHMDGRDCSEVRALASHQSGLGWVDLFSSLLEARVFLRVLPRVFLPSQTPACSCPIVVPNCNSSWDPRVTVQRSIKHNSH